MQSACQNYNGSESSLPQAEATDEHDEVHNSKDLQVVTVELRIPQVLETMNSNLRWMFHHFSEHVSPVMILFDGHSNGYRHHILPYAVSNNMVQRAVCVAAAFHLIPHRPELRAPAEQGRAAIIQKLREEGLASTTVFDEATWATILLLIVGDLVTGDEQVMILYHMLDALIRAREHYPLQSPLSEFLKSQSTLIQFFGRPIVSEEATFTRMAAISDTPFLNVVSGSDKPPDHSPLTQRHIRTYNKAFRHAIRIYLNRARAPTFLIDENYVAHEVGLLKQALQRVDPAYPGAHVLVWPSFVGAAEATSASDRAFFTQQLNHIWTVTGFANVCKALNALPGIWNRRGSERWTSSLPKLSVVVM
ncbi:Fc.00g072510.m01.CDS01 [Cosmosporella sp. VM-42]